MTLVKMNSSILKEKNNIVPHDSAMNIFKYINNSINI